MGGQHQSWQQQSSQRPNSSRPTEDKDCAGFYRIQTNRPRNP